MSDAAARVVDSGQKSGMSKKAGMEGEREDEPGEVWIEAWSGVSSEHAAQGSGLGS